MYSIRATYIGRICIALSVLLNVMLGGSSNQTFSARNYDWKRNGKPNLVFLIDGISLLLGLAYNKLLDYYDEPKFDPRDHCMNSWVYWATRKKLEDNEIRKMEHALHEEEMIDDRSRDFRY